MGIWTERVPFVLAVAGAEIFGGLLAGLLDVGCRIVIVRLLEAVGTQSRLAIKIAVATALATIVPTPLSSAPSHHAKAATDYEFLR